MYYEVTLELGEAYASQVFGAPSDDAAIAFARNWPTLNGWLKGTKIELAYLYIMQVDHEGNAMSHSMRSIIWEAYS